MVNQAFRDKVDVRVHQGYVALAIEERRARWDHLGHLLKEIQGHLDPQGPLE